MISKIEIEIISETLLQNRGKRLRLLTNTHANFQGLNHRLQSSLESELDVGWAGMAGCSKEGFLSEAQISEGSKRRALPVAPLASMF